MVTQTIEPADILSRLDVPMTTPTAESVVQWKFSDDAIDCMNDLAEKARQGTLTPQERASVEVFEHLNNLLGIIKSRARQHLKSRSESPTS
jgi:hypothetical protein